MLWSLLQILVAYLLMDIATGFFHFFTDKGWNFRHFVTQFQDHHYTDTMKTFDWQPSVVALPAFLASWFIQDITALHFLLPYQVFCIAFSYFGIISQVPHYFAHHPPKQDGSYFCLFTAWIVFLQATGCFITPSNHNGHHDGVLFNRNYCVMSCWNNWWINPFFQWLDRLIPNRELSHDTL